MRNVIVCLALVAGCSGNKSHGGDMSSAGLQLEPNAVEQGGVELIGIRYADGTAETELVSGFVTTDGKPGPCSIGMLSGCTVRFCPAGDAGGGMATSIAAAGMGTATLGGGAAPITFETNGTTFVESTWLGGESLSVQATGNVVPAFNVMLTAPPRAKMLTPKPTTTGTMPLMRSAGLPITWQPVTPGDLKIELSTPTKSYSAVCTVAGTAGAYTVPPAALMFFPSAQVALSASVVTQAHTTAGTWPVDVIASSPTTDPAGNPWGLELSLQ
jgi:hypothetical protein